ncbi:hypothetical protein BU15DRAFT_65598 [Melanogaster broomeanus]|nr:hypothetical protein BU15DRAFT_65598 [Melanogaster broomeanus]
MAIPPTPEHHPWLPDTNASLSTYTRGYDVSIGVKFHSTLAKSDLQTRTRGAFERLRFHCPLIAASIDDKAAWVYMPVQDDTDREAWLQGAFVFEDKGPDLDFEDFISSLTQPVSLTRLMDDHSFSAAILSRNPSPTMHCMDAWPTLIVLSLMFGWMSVDSPLEKPVWGTEWNNLPPNPVTRRAGLALPGTQTAPGYTKLSQRIDHDKRTESGSQAIVAVTKANECTVSHLLEVAHCLALAACNPPDPAGEADFGAEMTIASLEPRLSKTHFVSAFVHLPVRIRMPDILKNNSKVQQMQLTMQALKEQYKQYLDNPCIYHLLVAQKPFATPYTRPQFRSMLTNIGVTEKRLRTTWKGQGGEPIFEIDELLLGNRMTTAMTSLHSRSIKDALYLQLLTSDMWKDTEGNDAIMQKFVAEIMSPNDRQSNCWNTKTVRTPIASEFNMYTKLAGWTVPPRTQVIGSTTVEREPRSREGRSGSMGPDDCAGEGEAAGICFDSSSAYWGALLKSNLQAQHINIRQLSWAANLNDDSRVAQTPPATAEFTKHRDGNLVFRALASMMIPVTVKHDGLWR